ncbi:MAG: ABC transporter permease subunit [Thermoanaerobaculia bacterium]
MSSVADLPGGGPTRSARPGPLSSARRRLLADRVASRFVTLSGVLIIAAILAILFVIAAVVYPLLLPPSSAEAPGAKLPPGVAPLAVAVDEYREDAFVATAGGILMVHLGGEEARPAELPALGEAKVVRAVVQADGLMALGLSDGRIYPVRTGAEVTYPDGKRKVEPGVTPGEPLLADESGRAIAVFKYVAGPDGPIAVYAVERDLTLLAVTEKTSLMGESTRETTRERLPFEADADVTALALDTRGQDVFAGLADGRIVRIDRMDPSAPRQAETVEAAPNGTAITELTYLNGDRTLVVGDALGGVSTWQVVVRNEARSVARVNVFEAHPAAVTSISPSRRDKGFVTADAKGGLKIHYGTTGKTLLRMQAGTAPVAGVAFAPKADGIVAVAADGAVKHFSVKNPHPEVTWRSLFGKVWYEGYPEPEYVWQSTGGTDDFEAKFSLTPLIYGTLKGTFFALLVAIPLALLAALYTSQFMHPSLRSVVKPAVEIMAALPSVVLGFIAGLWLAPMLERIVPGLVLAPFVVTALSVLASWAWGRIPSGIRGRVPHGWEVALLVPLVVGGIALAIWLGGLAEASFLQGDYRQYLLKVLGVTYDQRNSLVVGIAMGFAVIPIIFTVAEDSLSSVPPGLAAGSLALGATRWQTALRTVLPTASPGIFSAIMIGFGRAVGETMIVLMATGNTPVMNMSVFSGFRALSANIAVELPEAPVGGTLFRVLFLAALLLFVMTFLVNTAAELVRLRLRRKYRTFE